MENEVIISLKCHEAHIFHENCLKTWTLECLVCPLCREKLHIIEKEDSIH